ncbi:Scr1 family TA system antitoxin-like transcriptional regulator [Streptomyces sp. NPDC090303]|uniref:Scr1 family TA system antitoxin-like transcriptional regulator n=1 Tax=Streptomyces sp. NPDC090303 TaxID=3365960 RepID=UPI0038096024
MASDSPAAHPPLPSPADALRRGGAAWPERRTGLRAVYAGRPDRPRGVDRPAGSRTTPTELLRTAVDRVDLGAREAVAAGRRAPEAPWLLDSLRAHLARDARSGAAGTAGADRTVTDDVLTAEEGRALGALLRDLTLAPARSRDWVYSRTELLSWAPRLGALLHVPAELVPEPSGATARPWGEGAEEGVTAGGGGCAAPSPEPGPRRKASDGGALADAAARGCTGPAGRFAVARALREIRCRAGLTQRQLARAARVSLATVNRYEAWRDTGGLRVETVLAVARACGATESETRHLAALVRTQLLGWWEGREVAAHEVPLLSFEDSADEELSYAGGTMPRLLRTEEYAAALRTGAGAPASPYEGAPGPAGGRRSGVPDRETGPLTLRAVLDEGTLHRRVGGRGVMARQCEHLMLLAHRPHVEVRVLPFDAGADAVGMCGPFAVVSWRDPSVPGGASGIVHRPEPAGASYADEPEVVGAYRESFARMWALSLDEVESLYVISEARGRFT